MGSVNLYDLLSLNVIQKMSYGIEGLNHQLNPLWWQFQELMFWVAANRAADPEEKCLYRSDEGADTPFIL